MTTVRELAEWLEGLAPAHLAESWDNIGLLWGDPAAEVRCIMTCLTVTKRTAEEAVAEEASLIVSHHPILFRGAKQVRADVPATAPLWLLARSGIAVLSPHTAFDSTRGGINDGLCHRLGLTDVVPLRPLSPPPTYKVVVFTPEVDQEAVLQGAFNAGAGRIGDYDECSFAIPGHGTFFGNDSSNPSVGQKGQRETVQELRLEVLCPGAKLAAVLAAIRTRHSYEEPAIDVYPLHGPSTATGSGRIGRFLEPRGLQEFAQFVSRALGHISVHFVGEPSRMVQCVAVACGAGDDFLADAARAGADVLLTGEARFHQALEAEALGVGLVLAGHYGTERPGVEDLAEHIALAFPDVTVWPSQRERDPLILVASDESLRAGR